MTLHIPQHIKKPCTSQEFMKLIAGEKICSIRIANFEIEEGDLLTFFEIDDMGTRTGKTLTKKVVETVLTKDLDATAEERENYGYLVLGLQPPEVNTLRSVFSGYFSMAFVLERLGSKWVSSNASYWPLLICPDLEHSGLLDYLKFDRWPEGLYAVHLKVKPTIHETAQPAVDVSITDSFVLAFVLTDDDLTGVEVDTTSLLMGKSISALEGYLIEPSSPVSVRNYLANPPRAQPTGSMFIAQPGDLTHSQLERLMR